MSIEKATRSMIGTDDLKIIEGVIQSYLAGLYEGDVGKIASVFHPTSALTSFTNDGKLVITPRDEWLDKFGNDRRPKSRACPATTLLRDRNGIAQLRRIDSNERAVMMIHDSPSLLEALPGQSG